MIPIDHRVISKLKFNNNNNSGSSGVNSSSSSNNIIGKDKDHESVAMMV